MKVYELIQELAGYPADDLVEILLPGGHSFGIEGVRESSYRGNIVLDIHCDESDLAEIYQGEGE